MFGFRFFNSSNFPEACSAAASCNKYVGGPQSYATMEARLLIPYEPYCKLLKGAYIRAYMGDYCRGY